MRVMSEVGGKTAVIPHGIAPRFAARPRPQRSITEYSAEKPFRVLYVSIIDLYKHQWHLVEAVARLRQAGLPVALDLVGPRSEPAFARLNDALSRFDPEGSFVRYLGAVPHAEMQASYAEADLCVFASSCENMPNILLEGMASGLPIVCSDRGPMPEVLGDAGAYCDPENPDDIARAIRGLVVAPELRSRLAWASFTRSQAYSWQRCAAGTLGFLREAASSRVAPVLAGERS
jgi:glycosyltransferase involved in cell wall biosynthesis